MIKDLTLRWATQTKIDPNKHTEFLACLFHFHVDVGIVMKFLGGNYTMAHQDVEDIIKQIMLYADRDLNLYFQHVMTTGCPNICNTGCWLLASILPQLLDCQQQPIN